jgi:hypothetical protein
MLNHGAFKEVKASPSNILSHSPVHIHRRSVQLFLRHRTSSDTLALKDRIQRMPERV